MKIHSNPYIYNVKCIYCSKTVQSSFSPGMKKKKKHKQELPYLHKGVNKQRLALMAVYFLDSNGKVTLNLQILLKPYNFIKTTNLR